MSQDPWEQGSSVRLSEEFVRGLRYFRAEDWESAIKLFRAAEAGADISDIYQRRYTSYHGLARVYSGDSNGVKLCRKAAVGEDADADVYYNLALAEIRLNEPEGASMAVRRGLAVDASHAGLRQLSQENGSRRKRGSRTARGRESFFGRLLEKIFRSRQGVQGDIS